MRLHTRRAINGSYNLKDPPGSPKLMYPGPQWVPDSLRASWCAAETLTRCSPHGTPVTYKSMRRMLDYVLPHQRERCKVGIELMLRDGRFTPERAPSSACSFTNLNLSRLEPPGLRNSPRRGSPRAPHLQDDYLDKLLESHQEAMTEFAKWRDEPKPTLWCSEGSTSETTPSPRVGNPYQTPNVAGMKVSAHEAQSRLERVQVARPYVSSSYTELERISEAPFERVMSSLPSSESDASAVVQEQSHKTVLTREPPKGSSLSDVKPSSEMVRPVDLREPGKGMAAKSRLLLSSAHAPVHSELPQPNPRRGNVPRVLPEAIQKVSASETRSSPERVQIARYEASPSSAKPDCLSAPPGFSTGPPSVALEFQLACKPLTEGSKPQFFKLSPETVVPISRPSPSLSMHAKPLEQSNKTVLSREFPRGNSLTGVKPSSRDISALASPIRVNPRASMKPSTTRREVSTEKGPSAAKCSPLPNAAPMLRKSTPVSSLRAPAARSSEDGATLSFPTNSIRHTLETVSTRRVVRVTAHREPETPSQLSREAAPPRSVGPAVEQALVLSSSKEGEERRVYDTVVSIQRKSEGPHSPSSETARKQSNPSEVTEGKWLARAAMYIRERMNARSSVCDEFIRCTLKGPPDKSRASEATKEVQRCDVDVVNEESKASVSPRSPGTCPESSKLSRSPPEAAILQCSSLSLHSCKKTRLTVTSLSPVLSVKREIFAPFFSSRSARFSQTFPSPSQPSSGLSGPFPKSSDDEDYKPQPLKVVSLTHASSVEQHSPEIEGSAPYPVLRPGITQTSLSRLPSLEEWWQARCKPPDVMAEPEQRNNSLVSNNGGSSATKRSPLTEAVYTLPIPPSARSLRMCNPHHTSPELVWRVLQPPDWAAIRRSLNRVVSKFEPRRRNSHSPLGSVRFASSVHVFSCLHTALEISH